MAPERWLARLLCALAPVALTLFAAPAAQALRIVNYNITNYPGVLFPARQPHFRTILGPLGADVVVVQEIQSQAGVDSFRTNVLNVLEPGQWLSAPFTNGNDTDNGLFYKPTRVQFLGQRSFYVSSDQTRLVNEYVLQPVGYSDSSAQLRLYSVHLKASTGSSNEQQRLREATGLRDTMNAVPPGRHLIALGDFNIYSGAEPAFAKLLESQANNNGRLYDPLNAPLSSWRTITLAPIHTQCPCGDNATPSRGCPPGGGFSGGGLDDRFDMFLPTYNMKDGEGLDLLVSTYIPVGNDGLHYDVPITDPPTIPEGAAYANALINASDHLPVRVDIQLPAKISLPAALAFGTVIVGASASQNLAVSNPAVAPADELDYALAADPGFTAIPGPYQLNAGAPAANHAIGMDTGSAGPRAGYLLVSSDDPDNPLVPVTLSGNVLDHAEASLDSLSALLAQTLDFGDHPVGEFSTLMARVHNRGYDSQQAQLSVNSGVITGGAGRFSLFGGFTAGLVAGVAKTHTVQFNEAGATLDSAYTATLTFASADQPLPGAAAQPDLVVTLRAKVTSGAVGGPGGPVVPGRTQLLPPFPNPLAGTTTVRFDLAREAEVRLEVFDLAGRRVASLAEGFHAPGAYGLTWDGRDDAGAAVGAGLYFVRLTVGGAAVRTARLAIVR